MKNLGKILTLAGLIGLTGCADPSTRIHKIGDYEGYKAMIWNDALGNNIRLGGYNENTESFEYHITAIDNEMDGRFDHIRLVNVPKDNSLEKYANVTELKKVYDSVVKKGIMICPNAKRKKEYIEIAPGHFVEKGKLKCQ